MANLSAEEADLCPNKAAVEPMEVNSSDKAVEQVDTAQTQDQCPASTNSGNTHMYILHVLMVPTVNALFYASTVLNSVILKQITIVKKSATVLSCFQLSENYMYSKILKLIRGFSHDLMQILFPQI